MTAALRALPAAAILAAALCLQAPAAAAVELGPHGGLSPDHLGGCTACHRSTGSRRFDLGHDRMIVVPDGGKQRLAEPIARFCWACHREGNPYGARPLTGRILDAPGHRRGAGRTAVPEAWALGDPLAEPEEEGGLREMLSMSLTCTVCHDMHVGGPPDLLRRTGADGDFTALCSTCHPGRENAGLTGRGNMVARRQIAYSTHPAAAAQGRAAGERAAPSCGDCHDVHRAPAPGERLPPGLLRGAPGESATDLCRRCHAVPEPGSPGSHPMEAAGSGRLSPAAFATPDGIPAAWRAGEHFDGGATPIRVGEGGVTRCTSCHDLHGGLPGTSLLRGPAADPGEGWCFSCHAKEALLRLGHAADAAGVAGTACATCHGEVREGEPPRWGAHRGFREVHPPAAPGAVAGRPSGDGGTGGGKAAAGEVLRTAAGDARPEVRAQVASVIAAVTEHGERGDLLALLADPAAEVRAKAALALARTEDPRAAEGLLPLLADPAPQVRSSAISAFGTFREPRAIPGLVALLRDPDWKISTAARLLLASWNDARVLAAMVVGEEGTWAAAAHLIAVLEDLDDQAALPDILRLLGHRNRLVRRAAAEALQRYPGRTAAEALVGLLEDEDVGVKSAAAASLVGLGDPRAPGLLSAILRDPAVHPLGRVNMAWTLASIAAPEVVEPLVEALADGDARVREAANGALAYLTCRNFGTDRERWREWWRTHGPDFPLSRCR